MAAHDPRSETTTVLAEPSETERLWAAHMDAEFVTKDVDATMATMVEQPFVNHVPVMTGGSGHDEVRAFYATRFIPRMPRTSRRSWWRGPSEPTSSSTS